MPGRTTIAVCLLLLSTVVPAAHRNESAQADSPAGTWTGTWEGGDSSGGFELTLEKASDGRLGGRVSVTGEPTYKAELKTAELQGNKLTAAYEFPPEPTVEVTLAATLDGNTAKGAWTAREKASGAAVARGTFALAKK